MDHQRRIIDHYATVPQGSVFVRPEDVLALARSRPLRPDARMLDVGCGQGQAAIALALAYPQAEMIGIDLSPEQIEHARRAAAAAGARNVQFQVADWTGFGLPPDGVDLIVATQVIQFMPDEHEFAHYLASGLAADGHLLLRSVLLPEDEPGRSFVQQVMLQFIRHSLRFYSERDLTELLREAGLSRFRIDKEEMWLDDLPADRAAILDGELRAMGLGLDDVQPWFWAGTISAVRRA
ncbi:MAG TPA: methyltransferase domain-containing protein [Herpetosiphonaceae bacterium]|nr:methyltransferase domain-containing protein [Herpetosiphonaceae bacterium]